MPVQVFDIHTTAAGDDAIDFTAGLGSSWTIAPGTVVAADLGAGVSSFIQSSSLINHGAILATSTHPAVFFANSGEIINATDGSITGGITGIGVDHTDIDIVNFGSIYAEAVGVAFDGDTNNTSLDNRGFIFSSSTGVYDDSTAHGATIVNRGTIEGLSSGIWFDAAAGLTTHVINSGLIAGGSFAIYGGSASALDLQNSGRMMGAIVLNADVGDTIVNSGIITDSVQLGGGNDIFVGTGTQGTVFGQTGLDTLTGGNAADRFEGGDDNDALNGNGGADMLLGQNGNDTLSGGLGNDFLDGGIGNDTLFGGAGKDTLTGGLNNDFFVFNTALNASTNRDVITDFNHVADTFKLENAIFTKLGAGVHALNAGFFRAGAAAADANDYIVYNKATGVLSYDNDGSGSHAAIAFAVLNNKPVLAANDFQVI